MVQRFTRASQTLSLCLIAAATSIVCGTASAAPADTTRVIVSFKPGAKAAMKSLASTLQGTVKHEIFGANAVAMEVPRTALKGLENNPNVEFIEEDVKRYPLALATPSTGTPYATGQLVPYGIKMVQADQLSDSAAANRKVCIIDSGIDQKHEDLSGNNLTGEYDSGTGWWYTDENHHGTHVAGTIAGINNSGTGVVGVNPNKQLKLHIVKVFGADGWAYSSTLATAANKCKAAGANVVSMSLGGPTKSLTEQRAFDSLASAGILSIAAAGNDGNTKVSYPAGYTSVVSVGAVDENKAWATFSQYNSKVELAGPGVGVLSTVPMGAGQEAVLTVGSSTYAPGAMEGSPVKTATAPLADFGIGDKVNTAVSGKVCLIARGTVDFAVKVQNCQNSGGVGAVVYNNVAGAFGGTLGTTVTSIPSVTATDVEGTAMKSQLGQSATVGIKASNYAYYDGTSMATPHVSAVAALVWSYFPTCTAAQIRTSLGKSALDLGTAGRDTKYGFGLVQAKAAYDRIKSLGCGM
ncbi:S8 family serine peptidase [Massilia sp. Dwa41.01b]|uniref:S8 family serine peptidase n=1 Tax=unclassified Massilia TaxID=2609279 RepID=UPI0016016141|nr:MULTISPECIES: S8 family serine peptidase [unclassified Massilia]QNA87902.1 S8 family serine peptidase [Massilia sp. Dwa41.01b]QNA98805.1 S8 family serine peptidase [Massilia sp. Se16.2.3]